MFCLNRSKWVNLAQHLSKNRQFWTLSAISETVQFVILNFNFDLIFKVIARNGNQINRLVTYLSPWANFF